ncbi:hypothetical protein [Spirosoma sp. KUDC1026]|uniref:hypothetical protein n=1 Tax=Spirosoma sp. KUDC1026 TaxID=2745947 RepID=UPI00159BD603|nr:hypothetical protein [Spirosoma sp. KUDC1026]QKZ12254.1 hypothetical protein HU175_06280 [Spirosoma sp. KUDC1026]
MAIFTVRKVDAVQAKQELDELEIDGIGQLTAFEQTLEETDKRSFSEFRTLITYMNYVSDGKSLPNTKFRDVTPDGERVKEYEFKSKHLRIYAIKKEGGKLIILCGFKTTQKSDFRRFRSLKQQYLNSIGS